MTNPQRQMDDVELGAFIDGELGAARRAEIAKLIESDAAIAERVAAFQEDKALLRKLYAPIADKPIPTAWRKRIEEYSNRPRARFTYQVMAAIAATLVFAVGGLVAWQQLKPQRNPDIIAEALAARSDAIHPEAVIVASNATSASQTLSRVLQMRVKAPDLTRMGYRLRTIQIYTGAADAHAVELTYRNAQAQSFTLYIRRPNGPPRFDQFETGSVRVCIWQDDVLGTVMAGKMSAPEMQHLAALTYTGLTL